MKKLTLLMALVGILFAGANAQVEIKASIGTNFSGMHGDNFEKFKGSAGYQFGAGVLIGDKFYVEPGIQYGKMTSTITDKTTDLDKFELNQNFCSDTGLCRVSFAWA
jgi:type 1 glutamine amidotransferase